LEVLMIRSRDTAAALILTAAGTSHAESPQASQPAGSLLAWLGKDQKKR
jgi:hypothetical protein